ncbi:MAG: DMT family transporter [Methanocorpusculum sp.]|nr:DMT family transporter [Methanocorpusculum sp.]MDD2372575.1 DMT family transporter [Syntrophomonadaceae bacterium]MDD3270998.1 DMT family transporter [Syntrophomonadaceae bacterium]MDD3897775.1 DMT family transporter [Syntrophomonadaceae bacterium]MDD4561793.1 DMT family transporter [Syntrophomonadaceae bacterium]
MVQLKGALYLAGAFFMAGSSVVAARFVSGKLGVFTIAAVSLSLAFLVLLPVCRHTLIDSVKIMRKHDWMTMLLQALFGMFLFRMFLLQGLNYTSATEAGILTGATPALTALLARFLLKEPLYKLRMVGVASTIAGVLLIQGLLTANTEFSGQHILGNMLVLAAALCESSFNVLSRRGSIKSAVYQKLDPMVQTTLVTGIALLLCLVPAVMEHPMSSLMSLGMLDWLALIWYGLFVTALGYIFWYAGIKHCEASVAAAFSGLIPLTAMILAAVLLREQPETQQWLGGALVVLGMLATGLKSPSK